MGIYRNGAGGGGFGRFWLETLEKILAKIRLLRMCLRIRPSKEKVSEEPIQSLVKENDFVIPS